MVSCQLYVTKWGTPSTSISSFTVSSRNNSPTMVPSNWRGFERITLRAKRGHSRLLSFLVPKTVNQSPFRRTQYGCIQNVRGVSELHAELHTKLIFERNHDVKKYRDVSTAGCYPVWVINKNADIREQRRTMSLRKTAAVRSSVRFVTSNSPCCAVSNPKIHCH